jgi:hypothetical protein
MPPQGAANIIGTVFSVLWAISTALMIMGWGLILLIFWKLMKAHEKLADKVAEIAAKIK